MSTCGSDDNLSPHRELLLSGDMARPIWSIPWLQAEDIEGFKNIIERFKHIIEGFKHIIERFKHMLL